MTNTYIIYKSDGTITKCFIQSIEPDISDGENILIDNSISSLSNRDWRQYKVLNGEVVKFTDQNLDAEDLNRYLRNAILGHTDWTQIQDNGLSEETRAAWRTYRQQLRDLPEHQNWPNLNPEDWPTI